MATAMVIGDEGRRNEVLPFGGAGVFIAMVWCAEAGVAVVKLSRVGDVACLFPSPGKEMLADSRGGHGQHLKKGRTKCS
jgi:hypothetical protein